ncbi:hypothetical protein DL769_008578 [Monosporascus sp. CRB-8-3]|nr:hypothetical protein DL769_008578 [Monosporascus sp. CRB-8-3]
MGRVKRALQQNATAPSIRKRARTATVVGHEPPDQLTGQLRPSIDEGQHGDVIHNSPAEDAQGHQHNRVRSSVSNAVSNKTESYIGCGSDWFQADSEICYGSLCEAEAQFDHPIDVDDNGAGFHLFRILPVRDFFGLAPDSNEIFAVVDWNTCKTLRQLRLYEVKATAVVANSWLARKRVKGGKAIKTFPLAINVYGPMHKAHHIAQVLSDLSAFLQHPFYLEPGIEYFNPHFFHSGGVIECMTPLVGISESDYRAKTISDEVERILESLENTYELDADKTDADLQPASVLTPLKREDMAITSRSHRELQNFLKIPQVERASFLSIDGRTPISSEQPKVLLLSEDGSVFEKYIVKPLGEDKHDRAANLRALMRSVCLRRGDSYLKLDAPQYKEVTVELQPDERKLYNDVLQRCLRDIDNAISTDASIKKYSILFTAILKLRRLCNHGTFFLLVQTSSLALEPLGPEEADCDLCSGDDQDQIGLLNNFDFCTECGRSLVEPPQGPKKRSGRGTYNSASLQVVADYPPDLQYGRSTKLALIVNNLEKAHMGSKRLNLTAANNVHIVEPQWNPSIEQQAIARAVRMGQTRVVTVYRYVTRDTVEENILELQRKKSNLAKFTLDSGPEDEKSGKLEDLKFVLEIDKQR